MLSKWPWISRCGDYWQQAELRTDGACRMMMMMMLAVKCIMTNTSLISCTITARVSNVHSVNNKMSHSILHHPVVSTVTKIQVSVRNRVESNDGNHSEFNRITGQECRIKIMDDKTEVRVFFTRRWKNAGNCLEFGAGC